MRIPTIARSLFSCCTPNVVTGLKTGLFCTATMTAATAGFFLLSATQPIVAGAVLGAGLQMTLSGFVEGLITISPDQFPEDLRHPLHKYRWCWHALGVCAAAGGEAAAMALPDPYKVPFGMVFQAGAFLLSRANTCCCSKWGQRNISLLSLPEPVSEQARSYI